MHVAFVIILAAAIQGPPAEAPALRSPAPTPAPPLILEGTVKGPDGKPVQNALVVVLAHAKGIDEPPLHVRSDAQGRFRLVPKRPGALKVQIQASGFAAWKGERVMPGTPLDISLQKGLAVEGVVRDGGSGAPVPNARVTATIGVSLPWEPESGVVSALTDTKGRYRLESLARGLYAISVRAPGYDRAVRRAARAGGTADFQLLPGASLTGRVRGPDGQPVPGAMVLAEPDIRRSAPPPPERTDRSGGFELIGIAAGSYTVIVRHADFAPGLASGVLVESGLDTVADVSLPKGASVSGRLLGADDSPVAGKVVVQELNGRPVGGALAEVLRTEAGADGRFKLEKLPPGFHALGAQAAGHATSRHDFDVGARAASVNVGDILLERGLSIRGRVSDKAGHPIPEASIVGWVRQPGGAQTRTEARAASDGRFTLSGLAQASYQLLASASGYGEARRTAAPGEGAVEFVLDAAGHITGQVVDEEGNPVDSYEITAAPADESRSSPSTTVGSEDGRFRLEDVSPGAYVLKVITPERAPATRSDVVVTAGAGVDVGRIRLQRGGVVRGTVADSQGVPVAAATVSVEPATRGYSRWGGGAPQTISDQAGAFEVRGVAEGSAVAIARHPDYAEGRSESFEIDGRGAVEARIVLAQGGRIDGSARKRDGSPVGVGMVSTAPLGSPWREEPISLRSDGTFTIEHVPAGRVRVTLMQGATGRFTSGQHREVEVREDETSVVDFVQRDILVSGQVRRAGEPAPGLRITMRSRSGFSFYTGAPQAPASASGPQRLTALTRDDGRFEMLADEPGRVTVIVESTDRRLTLPPRSVEIPDADSFELDLDYSGVAVQGLVTDKQTGQPVAEASVSAQARTGNAGPAEAISGADGRFQLELEEGRYRLNVSADDYVADGREIEVPGSGEVVLALSRGAVLKGKVVDAAGRGVHSLDVTAFSGDPNDWSGQGWAITLPDGSFQFEPMVRRPVNVFAGIGAVGFGLAAGVVPGESPVAITLRPPGRVRLLIRGADGAPVAGANSGLTQVDGVKVWAGLRNPGSDPHGIAELLVPAGRIQLVVRKDQTEARISLDVAEGGATSAEVTLAPVPPGDAP